VAEGSKPKPPKGGRRGGKVIPHYALDDALEWSDKLVSKTYTSPQPLDLIKASVVGAKSGAGDIRVSALRQYGLLTGQSTALDATPLARQLKTAAEDEKRALIKQAALRPEVFKGLFETFHGDSIPIGKLRQRAAELGVHPDTAAKCAEIYVNTLAFVGLVERIGDDVRHVDAAGVEVGNEATEDQEAPDLEVDGPSGPGETGAAELSQRQDAGVPPPRGRGVATVQVTIAVDSTMDTEKLEKQLELLKRYGAL